jgi:1-deoxy-D-xylulose-5-phosphate reductoisomerase
LKKLFLLGSTGSIGRNTLEVISNQPEQFVVNTLVTNRNIELLAQQAQKYKPDYVVIYNKDSFEEFKKRSNLQKIKVLQGIEGIRSALNHSQTDVFVNAFVGFAGLEPTIEAIKLGIDIAIANKETLVVAGKMINDLTRLYNVSLLPIDSEHSAIWQCLEGEKNNKIRRIILTASGGPFRTKDKKYMERVQPEEALNHPNWKMGAKITIDSATLMNKGLEVIEAHWLYHVPPEKIEVIIHPQSIIHSMVEFEDSSIKAQLGCPDMRIPIQYALGYPYRYPLNVPAMDFSRYDKLTFEKPDFEKFPCLDLAFQVLDSGKTYPTAMNAANEVAVDAFLNKKIKFTDIPNIIRDVIDMHTAIDVRELYDYFRVDTVSREQARKRIKLKQNTK